MLDYRKIKRRFAALNRERIRRTKAALRPRQADFVDVLPLLFHINHPSLPGFVATDAPAGVSDYASDGEALDAARRIVKGFEYKRRPLLYYDIYSVFLMGSTGTIAHSSRSDFDIWVCHRPELTDAQLDALRQKCAAIENWAQGINLEVHFFVMDADKFRAGEVLALSSESSGTAQHHLLLDEFYRTALLLGGRFPLWWVVSPEHEADYDQYVGDLLRKRLVPRGEVIDFGGLGRMPAEEFFGATVWQVYKGIDSPYKSVLKIILMEIYARESPAVNFLSVEFKKAVYGGEVTLDQIDPYVMLLDRLTRYLQGRNEKQRLELMRRCFYFKVNLPLSKLSAQPGEAAWQQQLLSDIVRSWGWDGTKVARLDSRNTWKVDKVQEERRVLVEELTHSYFFLSNFAREQAGLAMISQRDLNLLGRKLYAAFERKSGKIEKVNWGIAPSLQEGLLALHARQSADGREVWMIHRGHGLQGADEAPLKRSYSLIELLLWCHFNGIVDGRTVFSLNLYQGCPLTSRELHGIVDTLQRRYPQGSLPRVETEDLLKPPRLLSVTLFVNVAHDHELSQMQLNCLLSESTEALNLGVSYEVLIHSIEAVFVTSWQEVLTYRYSGTDGMLECLCQYLQWRPVDEGLPPPPATIVCHSSSYGTQLARRIEGTFGSAVRTYYGGLLESQRPRYLLETAGSYALLHLEDGVIKCLPVANRAELMRQMAEPQTHFSPVIPCPSSMQKDMLSVMLRRNLPDKVQVFYYASDKDIAIFVLDERGSLFYQTVGMTDAQSALGHFQTFLTAIYSRQLLQTRIGSGQEIATGAAEFHQIMQQGSKFSLEPRAITARREGRFFNVQVIGDVNDIAGSVSIYCNDREFSSLEFGDRLFGEVARYVMQQRQSGLRYPIYITDIDIAPSLLGVEAAAQLQTIHYLNYKKRIEDHLNAAMEKL